MIFLRLAIALILAVCPFAATAGASVIIAFDDGTTQQTSGVTEASAGDDLGGMLVTAFFTDGSFEEVLWAATGLGTGAATGTGWSVLESGETFQTDPWTLFNSSGLSIDAILFDAGAGNAVFDTTFGGSFGTDGSFFGLDFDTSAFTPDITATYLDVVALTGEPPVGDLYRRLELRFTSFGGLPNGSSIDFTQDTDSLALPGDIHPVPEPGTAALATFGLCAALGLARTRGRAKGVPDFQTDPTRRRAR